MNQKIKELGTLKNSVFSNHDHDFDYYAPKNILFTLKSVKKHLKRAEKLSDVLRNLNKDQNELSFQALMLKIARDRNNFFLCERL